MIAILLSLVLMARAAGVLRALADCGEAVVGDARQNGRLTGRADAQRRGAPPESRRRAGMLGAGALAGDGDGERAQEVLIQWRAGVEHVVDSS